MSLLLSALLFAVFVANVALGASGAGAFLGDVGEMLLLFATTIMFVIAILKKEADRKANAASETK